MFLREKENPVPVAAKGKLRKMLAVLAVLLSAGGVFVAGVRSIDSAIRQFPELRNALHLPVPSEGLVCGAPVDVACSRLAAERVQNQIAWIPSLPGYESDGYVAARSSGHWIA